MSEVISGQDVIIDIYKVDGYYPFVCAEDVSIEIDMDIKSVKTIGSGKWREYRGQTLGWTITSKGLLPYDDDVNVTIFDMVDRQLNMLHVPVRIVFRDNESNVVKAVYGEGLVKTTSLNGPNDFAGGTFTMLGSGPLEILDGLTACDSVIESLSLDSQDSTSATFAYTGAVQAVRFDYRIFNTAGAFDISIYFGSVLVPDLPDGTFTVSPILPNGSQRIEVTPICENGEPGTMISLNYTKT